MGGMARRVGQVNVSFFAKVGNGKSSSANTLLQAWGYEGPPFEAKRQRGSVTSEIQTIEQKFHVTDGVDSEKNDDAEASQDVVLRVTDQPGLMDADGHVADVATLRGTAQSEVH